jgi:hypothetical protein
MATHTGHSHAHRHDHPHPALPGSASPLARGLGFRLAWAGGLSALLWLGVVWALQ